MKKIVFLCIVVLAGGVLQSQPTTVFFGQRVSNYYYWDTNWYDYYYDSVNGNPFELEYIMPCLAYFYGRVCYTATPLNVIGIAAPVEYYCFDWTADSTMEGRVPEYFRLYQGGLMAAEVRWDTNAPKYNMQFMDLSNVITVPVYEAYFNKPIEVHNIFYVGGTTWNNMAVGVVEDDMGNMIDFSICNAHIITRYLQFSSAFVQCDYHEIYKYISTSVYENPLLGMQSFDTNTFYSLPGPVCRLPAFFPIFDTLYTIYDTTLHDTCLVPDFLRVENVDSGIVTLTWSQDTVPQWELAVVAAGNAFDSAIVTLHPINYAVLDNLDTGLWYTARVRAVCDSANYSEWSDTVLFFLPGNDGDTVDVVDDSLHIDSPVDSYTYILPNPTSGNITVLSSFRIKDIKFFSADGKMLSTYSFDGYSSLMDISDYPSGTYFVRIVTKAGLCTKKVIKK